jgi:hypothetical protein
MAAPPAAELPEKFNETQGSEVKRAEACWLNYSSADRSGITGEMLGKMK